ncbi:hypothetical protein C8Q74DRAFT_1307483 [Fomes fomentarius]|nr:hypothetical protein C8Q74DRAFT_1307483 [Fomes fomentarius]
MPDSAIRHLIRIRLVEPVLNQTKRIVLDPKLYGLLTPLYPRPIRHLTSRFCP